MAEVQHLVDNHLGKTNHFLLKLSNESIHMKCDKDAEKYGWVVAVRACMARYNSSKSRDPRTSHKDSIDPVVMQEIMAEQEGRVIV